EEMPPDEAADILANLAPETSKEVIGEMEHREAAEVRELLRFEEHTAGGMMNTEIVVVGEDATRGEVIDFIRFNEIAPDELDNIVLINKDAALADSDPHAPALLPATQAP